MNAVALSSMQSALPEIVLAAAIGGWDLVVRINQIPPYVLPGPLLVIETLIKDNVARTA